MKRRLAVLALTLAFLGVLDAGVAGVLGVAERQGRLGALVQYFEYGRSVPGKLAEWKAEPGTRGNLYDVAWRPDVTERSRMAFAAEPASRGPVIRSYGMSFVGNVVNAAKDARPSLEIDTHGGPGAPPNFTYTLFHDDRENRRAGDLAIFGILSSAVPALAALSNRTWAFEQPAPFTYPVYHPEGAAGLRKVEPLVATAAEQRALDDDPAAAAAWARQMAAEDHFHSPLSFGAPALDRSPFVRLVRRSLAIGHIERTKTDILDGGYPYAEVLRRMVAIFAETARADGQIPVVMLIQSRDLRDPDILEVVRPALERHGVPHFATVEHFDPRDQSGFQADGHYRKEVDALFGVAFVELLERLGFPEATAAR